MTTTTANAGKVMQHLEYFLDVVWPDLKVHAHLGHRPVGGRGDRRAEGARHPGSLRHRHRGRQRRPALHGHRARRDRRRAGDDLPPLLLRRDGLRGLLRRRPRHPCLGSADRGRQAVRHGALRAGGAGHAAHREGPRHRRRDRRPHHGARPASRLDAVEEEAVHRLGDDGPRGPDRAPTGCSWSAWSRSTTGRSTAARISSSSSTRPTRATRSATSPPPAIRRRSASISRWRWSRAARRGTARAPSSPTRCATASGRSRSSATISSIPKGAACMVDQLSPLAPVWRPGAHGNVADGVGVDAVRDRSRARSSSSPPGRGEEKALIAAIRRRHRPDACPTAPAAASSTDGKAAFGFAPGKFLVVDQDEGLAATLRQGGRRRHRHGHRPVAWPHGDPHRRAEGRMGAGEILRDRLLAAGLPGRLGRLDRPSRHLRADPAHRRRPVRPLRLPLVRPLVLEGAVPCQRGSRLRGAVSRRSRAQSTKRHPLFQRRALGAQSSFSGLDVSS